MNGLTIASIPRLEKFDLSASKTVFSKKKTASRYMKHEKVICVADFDLFKTFFKMFLGGIYGCN